MVNWVCEYGKPDMAHGVAHVSTLPGGYGDIATVWGVHGESEKVGKLFAAAPDLLEALEALVNYYIANKGSSHEFVKCITPKHASELSAEERSKDVTWSKFDMARAAISKAKGEDDVQPKP